VTPRIAPRSAGRAAFAFVFVTVALDMLALGIIVPVLPTLILSFEGGSIARASTITGWFGFAWALMQFLCSPTIGTLSDRFGRRPVILLSNLGLGLDYLVMALAPSVGWLFLGRVLSGITSSSYPTATAYVADVTPADQRAARFGMLGAAFGLGFVIGPAVGGLLGAIDLRLPFWVAAALSLTNFAYGFFILPESLPRERRGRVEWRMAHPFGAIAFLRSRAALLGLGVAAFLYYVAHEVLPSLYVLYTEYRYTWNERQIGISLAAIGVCTTIVSALLVGPIVARLGERRALALGYACMTTAFSVFALAAAGSAFLCGIPFLSLSGIASPSLQALATRHVDSTEQGQLQGALSSLRGVGMMIGPLLFTQTFTWSLQLPHPVPAAPMFLAAACAGVAGFAGWLATAPRTAQAVS
jgi:DHA1 family tetracycline resistance protein-like MFS transporter